MSHVTVSAKKKNKKTYIYIKTENPTLSATDFRTCIKVRVILQQSATEIISDPRSANQSVRNQAVNRLTADT